jgi:fructokinase
MIPGEEFRCGALGVSMKQTLQDRLQPIIFGEALVDVFHEGDVAGGAPFNVARHLAALGLAPLFVTRIGDDARGRMLSAELGRFGMDLSGVQIDPHRASGEVRVDESAPGVHSFTILADRAWDHIAAEEALRALDGWSGRAGLLYYGTLAQRHAASRGAIEALRARYPQVGWCDLNWRAGQLDPAKALAILRTARTLKVNESELHMVLDWIGARDAALDTLPAVGLHSDAVARLCAAGATERVVVTYGAAGYAAFDRGGRCAAAGAAEPVSQMVDTVGSGDAFTAVVIAGELCGWSLESTLVRANAFAAALCAVRGAAPEDLAFYESWRLAWGL